MAPQLPQQQLQGQMYPQQWFYGYFSPASQQSMLTHPQPYGGAEKRKREHDMGEGESAQPVDHQGNRRQVPGVKVLVVFYGHATELVTYNKNHRSTFICLTGERAALSATAGWKTDELLIRQHCNQFTPC